jgi:AraC family transcriptional activator of pobA
MSDSKYALQTISDHNHEGKAFHVLKLQPLKSGISREYHRHDYHEIVFFERGGGEHIIDFKSHKINNYSAHFVLPGQVHKLNREKKSNGYALLFSEDLILKNDGAKNNLMFDLPFYNQKLANNALLSKNDYAEITYLLDKLITEQRSTQILSETVSGAYLTLILFLLNRVCLSNHPQHNADVNSKTTLLIKFKRLIEQNFLFGHKPGDYAAGLNITTGYLNDLVKEAFNKTTGEIIQERIILESKRLLFYTDLTVNEIAFKLGFDDPAYFARLFKKHLNSTPKEYRINIREKSV